jgi:hypothetical protein
MGSRAVFRGPSGTAWIALSYSNNDEISSAKSKSTVGTVIARSSSGHRRPTPANCGQPKQAAADAGGR